MSLETHLFSISMSSNARRILRRHVVGTVGQASVSIYVENKDDEPQATIQRRPSENEHKDGND